MPFDPTRPLENTDIDAAEMRGQLTGLKDLIDIATAGGVIAAQIDSVTTVNAGDPATVNVTFAGGVLHFTLALPRGNDGPQGIQGYSGNDGAQGPPFASLIIDSVTTLPAGSAAFVNQSFDGISVHLSFGIPVGNDGAQGVPGEVSAADLTAAIDATVAGSSANTNSVPTLNMVVNDPPSAAEVQAVANKIDELIIAMRRP